ncbi:hypothetical protein K439DRAFT_1131405 [Ramaria rubella]|nr:hypothetical protein K439DRAFT_1131405 [Ramaria rubella]
MHITRSTFASLPLISCPIGSLSSLHLTSLPLISHSIAIKALSFIFHRTFHILPWHSKATPYSAVLSHPFRYRNPLCPLPMAQLPPTLVKRNLRIPHLTVQYLYLRAQSCPI